MLVLVTIRSKNLEATLLFVNFTEAVDSIHWGKMEQILLALELDTTLLNTQHYKVRFKGKVEQSWEWSSALPYTLV